MRRWRIMRCLARYGTARGNLLSGGVAYSGLFSMAAALTIAWTAFTRVLGADEQLRESVIEAVNSALPGLVKDEHGNGIVSPSALVWDSGLHPATLVAAPVLLWSATSVMQSLASSVRAVFGITTLKQNFLAVRLRALGGFVVLAVGIVASSVLTVLGAPFGRRLLGFVGVEGATAGVVLQAAGLLASFVVDALVVVFLVRVMSSVRVPRRDLVAGALLASVALTGLRLAGALMLRSVSNNVVLASFAALAALLLWLNLATRAFLVSVAYMANPPAPYVPAEPGEVHAKESPNFVTLSAARTLAWPHNPLNGDVLPAGSGACHREPPRSPEEDEPGAPGENELCAPGENELCPPDKSGPCADEEGRPRSPEAAGPDGPSSQGGPGTADGRQRTGAGAGAGAEAGAADAGAGAAGTETGTAVSVSGTGENGGEAPGRVMLARRRERPGDPTVIDKAQDDYQDGVRGAVGQE